MGQCDTLVEDIEVVPEQGPPSLSDFSADEWRSWLADAGSELATFMALIVVALILGWLVMREPFDLEEEAKGSGNVLTLNMWNRRAAFWAWTTTCLRQPPRSCQRKSAGVTTVDTYVRCAVVEECPITGRGFFG